jgi:hypothetical protein
MTCRRSVLTRTLGFEYLKITTNKPGYCGCGSSRMGGNPVSPIAGLMNWVRDFSMSIHVTPTARREQAMHDVGDWHKG